MRVFRYEDIREQQAIEGDDLHERWLARHVRGPVLQVLKLRAELATSEGVMAAWLRQAELNAACQAPGFLPVVDAGVHGGAAFAAREHAADALPLSTVLALLEAQGESVSTMLAVHIARALCETLNVAHGLVVDGRATPLIHGDLCAERVIVRASGRLQLTELGFYARLSEQAPARAARRNAEHVAPELARGGGLDARADVFALGILLRRMLVPSSGQSLSGPTRRIVPVLPSHEMVVLMSRLIATSIDERPRGVIEVLQELAKLPAHGAGTAVLSQLHEDARARFYAEPKRVPQASGVSSRKTELFVAPLARSTDPRSDPAASAAGESSGGFRGRTQIFGSPPIQVVAASAAKATPAQMDRGRFGTARLPPAGQPPMLRPNVAPSSSLGDEMPPLLEGHHSWASETSAGTLRLDMTGMPPLLYQPAPSGPPSSASDQSFEKTSIDGMSVIDGGAATRVIAPNLAAIPREPALPERPGADRAPPQPRRPSIRPGDVDAQLLATDRQSGLRPSPTSHAVGVSVPVVAALEVSRTRPSDPGFASEQRRREPWREASETVFKLKTPAIVAKLVPRERMSPVMMFVVAMLAAAMLIVIIRIVVGLIV